MSEAQRSASFMSPGLSVKLPLRKENDARLLRDERSDLAEGGRLPWKDDRADGGRKLMVYSRLCVLVSLSLWATRVVVLYSHLFVGASGCPGGVGALRMFLRRLARSYGPLLGSNCGVDFVMAALQPRDPAR